MHLKTVWAFVHKVTNKHQFVTAAVIFDSLQELGKLKSTAMYIPNDDQAPGVEWVKVQLCVNMVWLGVACTKQDVCFFR